MHALSGTFKGGGGEGVSDLYYHTVHYCSIFGMKCTLYFFWCDVADLMSIVIFKMIYTMCVSLCVCVFGGGGGGGSFCLWS